MSVHVSVPTLGESITEAIIARWEVQEGQYIAADAPLVELETDKITVSVPAPVGGIVERLLKGSDDRVAVGEVIAHIREQAAPTATAEAASPAPALASPAPIAGPVPTSPSVRRLAEEHSIDPATVAATGPRGRVTKGDMLQHVANQAPATPPAPPSPPPRAIGSEQIVPMSTLRRRVAQRLLEAQQNAAILTTFNEVDMSAVMALRSSWKEAFAKRYGVKLGFMSFFVKACIEALKAYPAVNAELRGDDVVYKNFYHVGVAVGGGKGLVVPVVRDADQLSFAEVEQEIGRLAERAVNNRLTLDELTHGTFTISNGGVYGSMMSTPILNPPQPGILGMHSIIDRPVVVDGQIVARPMMYLALSYDHRLIDGREAVGFLIRVKECIEAPERMLLEV